MLCSTTVVLYCKQGISILFPSISFMVNIGCGYLIGLSSTLELLSNISSLSKTPFTCIILFNITTYNMVQLVNLPYFDLLRISLSIRVKLVIRIINDRATYTRGFVLLVPNMLDFLQLLVGDSLFSRAINCLFLVLEGLHILLHIFSVF